MKQLLAGLILLAGCAHTAAKPDAPQAPAAAPAPVAAVEPAPVTDGDVTTATVNGVLVIVKRIPGAELAAGQLYIRGGVRDWTAQNAGIEALALHVATEGGTTKLDKDAYARKLARLGSAVGSGSANDYSVISATTLREGWDETFQLQADAFLIPALPASQLEVVRQRQLASIKHEQESPDGQVGLLMHHAIFKGHPYDNRPIGTLETVGAVKSGQLAPFLAKLRETSRLFYVAVGDLDPAHVIAQVKATYGALPRGDYANTPIPPLTFTAANLVTQTRKLPTHYLRSVFPAVGWDQPAEMAKGMVAMRVLYWRLFDEVRTKRNLSYAPGAFLSPGGAAPLGGMSVTAVDPDTTIKVMFDQARRLQTEPVPAEELAGDKSVFLTGYLMGNQSTSGQASLLGTAQLYGGDWHLARKLPDAIRSVTAQDVQAFAKRYIGKLQTAAVGDPTQLDPALFHSL